MAKQKRHVLRPQAGILKTILESPAKLEPVKRIEDEYATEDPPQLVRPQVLKGNIFATAQADEIENLQSVDDCLAQACEARSKEREQLRSLKKKIMEVVAILEDMGC